MSNNYEKLLNEVRDGMDMGQVEMKVVITIREGGEIIHRVTEHSFLGRADIAGALAINAAMQLMTGAQGGLDVPEE